MRFDRPKPLTAAQQFLNLKTNPVCAGSGSLHAGHLLWRYSASPSPLSREYALRIDYRQGRAPRAYVDAPDLCELADGRRLPHVYRQKPCQLCLYLPHARQWDGWMRIDQTIVPWALLWLFYFEEWLFSDEWKGEGVHPGDERRQRRDRTAAMADGEASFSIAAGTG